MQWQTGHSKSALLNGELGGMMYSAKYTLFVVIGGVTLEIALRRGIVLVLLGRPLPCRFEAFGGLPGLCVCLK